MTKGGTMKPKFFKMAACFLLISILMMPLCVIAAEKINLNTATVEQLTKLKGIGPSYAQRIIDYREKNGPFKKIEDLMKVKGIGKKAFEANKEVITVK